MDSLNFYDLEAIFSYLPIIERIRIEQVCFNWKNTARKSWSGLKKLDLSEETWGKRIFGPENVLTKYNNHILHEFLLRYGEHVTNIKLNYHCFKNNVCEEENLDLSCIKNCPHLQTVNLKAPTKVLNIKIMNMIDKCNNISELSLERVIFKEQTNSSDSDDLENNLANLCSKNKKLTVIRLYNIIVSDHFLNNFITDSINKIVLSEKINFDNSENCPFNFKNLKKLKVAFGTSDNNKIFLRMISNICYNLTELILNLNNKSYELEIAKIFSVNKIKKLNLKCSNITGICLLNLKTESMKTLKLFNCDYIKIDYLISALKNLKDLSKLCLCFSESSPLSSQCLEVISNCSKLEYLKLNLLSEKLITIESLNQILNLKNLKVLYLEKCFVVTDNFLTAVSKQLLNVSNLTISFCENITDEGVNEVCKLPNLKFLFIDGLKISGIGLGTCKNLIALSSSGCKQLEEKHLCKLVENCLTLRYLEICFCSKITPQFYNFTDRIVSNRSSNKILTISTYFNSSYEKEIHVSENIKIFNVSGEPFIFLYNDLFDYLKLREF